MAPSTRFLIESPDQVAQRQTGSLAGLAIALLLVVLGLYLVDQLRAEAAFQDCVLAGHAGCEAPGPLLAAR